MTFEDIKIESPSYAFKNCDNYTVFHNIIPNSINKHNQVLVYNELVVQNNSLENKVILTTREKINGRKSLIYLFQWDTELEPKLLKRRLIEILKAI